MNTCISNKYALPFSCKKENGVIRVTKRSNKLPSLEESLTEVSQLIDKMEHGELTLEQSLTHFERGIALVKHCQKILTEAEQKVKILIQNNHQEELSVYEENQNESPERNEHDD